ncbi:MAG: DUF3179 domain-containing protein [Hyphomicrobiales bacterium]|nr:DUF3179 domain-containing protein [Hyphomicrobiales bacterium]
MIPNRTLAAVTLTAFIVLAAPGAASAAPKSEVYIQALALVSRVPGKVEQAAAWFTKRGEKDVIPALVQALRYSRSDNEALVAALTALAGESAGTTWHDWVVWQEKHPDIKPFAGFDSFKTAVMTSLDPAFIAFLYPGVAHEIRLEEIVWGGVFKDGIPALTNPKHIAPTEADYITNDELVFGVEINGDARAYPLRILDWHEMFNDVIGGVPVSLAYCTLCASGILFEADVEGRSKPFVFGSSGFLYRSNKLMYDTETNSLWNQFTGRPVVGTLTGSGIELKTRPVVITRWSDWLKRHPETKVLSLDTGYARDYSPGKPYGDYFASPDLMFPVAVDQSKLKAKDYVFALRGTGTQKAWPLSLFEKQPVINDTAGAVQLTLIGDARTRTVRAYRTQGQSFTAGNAADAVTLNGKAWAVTEDALVSADGEKLHRLPGHIAYWFAWSGYLGREGEVASGG